MARRDGDIDFESTVLSRAVKLFAHERALPYRNLDSGWIKILGDPMSPQIIGGFRFPLNSAASSAITRDKIAMSCVLMHSSVESVAHFPLERFELGFPTVTKPRNGTGGRDVRLWFTASDARAGIARSDWSSTAACCFIDIECERRLVILDGETLIAFDKEPNIDEGFPLHNLSRGGRVLPLTVDELPNDIRLLGMSAVRVLGLRAASVDLVLDRATGTWGVLEVNDGIMLEGFSRHSSFCEDQAVWAYTRILESIRFT